MALPASMVDIYNLALGLIGEAPITSVTPPTTDTEIVVANHGDSARQLALRTYVWNFAKRRAQCSRTRTPAFDYSDAYGLPNNCLRVLSVSGDSEAYATDAYDIEGRELLINASGAASVNIRYIADVDDVSLWDPAFRRIVVLHIALSIAYQITKKEKVVAQINDLLKVELPDATSIDGQEVPPIVMRPSRRQARRRNGSYGNTAGPWTYIP